MTHIIYRVIIYMRNFKAVMMLFVAAVLSMATLLYGGASFAFDDLPIREAKAT